MKFLGKIFLFLVFAAVVSVIYYWQVLKQPLPFFPSAPEAIPESTTNIYKNDLYKFQFEYDKKYIQNSEDYQANYFKQNGVVLTTISIPSSIYPKTNFGTGTATFSIKNEASQNDCQSYVTGANTTKKMAKTTNLGPNKFYIDQFSGAAAGTRYDTVLYRILKDEVCYEINLTVGLGNIGNYEPGAVSEITKEEVLERLDNIAKTFRFIEATTETLGILEGNVNIGSTEPDLYAFTQIVVYNEDKTKVVKKIDLNGSGNYYAEMPVGVYYITYSSISTKIQPPLRKITVTAGKTVTEDFTIQN
jgi:hypothetical protein